MKYKNMANHQHYYYTKLLPGSGFRLITLFCISHNIVETFPKIDHDFAYGQPFSVVYKILNICDVRSAIREALAL